MKQTRQREGAAMEAITTPSGSLKELAYRESDGIVVTLLWNERDDRLMVSVLDGRTGEFFELKAPRKKALDVFYHPYSYAGSRAVLDSDAPVAA
jgi:hypothetical protein